MSSKYKELYEAFKLMEVGDPLVWDVSTLRAAYNRIQQIAKDWGWKIKVKCKPPLTKCGRGPGRLLIERRA